MSYSRLLATAGMLLILVSLFAPWISIPLGGELTLFDMIQRFAQPLFALVAGYLVALCVFGLWALLRSRPRFYLGIGIAALLAWLVAFGLFNQLRRQAVESAQQHTEGAAGVGLSILQNMQLGWGVWALLLAAVILCGAFLLRPRSGGV